MSDSDVIVSDVLVLGAGLAGCRAAVEACASGRKVHVVSKTHPLRSHSGAAQGGINVSVNESSPLLHIKDTLAGAAGLADTDAVEILCGKANDSFRWLLQNGAVFNRTPEGKIAQRAFGGQSVNRTCYSEDRTGMTLLQTVYEQAGRSGTKFFSDYLAVDLLEDESGFFGAVCVELSTGNAKTFLASSVLLASGGCCRAWAFNTNAHSNTGDIQALVLRHGLPLKDMEFIQFHPTGLYPSGILMSEAARSLGGRFLTADKEPLLEIYNRENSSSFDELATRDKLAFILATQISRQNDERNYVYLDLSHLEESAVRSSLPELCELARVYANRDLAKEPVPISPTAHYSMGGIHTDAQGHVLDWESRAVNGLFAAGECACVSVHGANRLGGNSLQEALVFGEIAGRTIAASDSVLPPAILLQRIQGLRPEQTAQKRQQKNQPGQDWMRIRKTLRQNMTQHCGVLRSDEGLSVCLRQVERLKQEYDLSSVPLPSAGFSLSRQEFFELGCMLDVSLAVVRSALSRKESRGAHQRLDYPDCGNLPLHSLYRGDQESLVKTVPVRGSHE